MQIALITHKVDLEDGQGRVNFEIARALLLQGHSVTVVAEYCSREIANHPGGRFVCMRNHPLPTQFFRNLYFAFKCGRWVRQHRSEFDLIQANGFVMWEPADVVAVHFVHTAWLRSAYFPFRASTLSAYSWYQRLLTKLNSRYELAAFQQARLLIAVSHGTAKDVKKMGIPASKLRVIYNGVDVQEFHPGVSERTSFGLPESGPLALFAGDIRSPRKNLDSVLRALMMVPSLHLVVAGSTSQSEYPSLASALGVSDRVHFIGHTNRMAALMRSVDFFVLPSRYDSYGMVVLEAMVSGLPVILSRQVGAVEFAAPVSLVLPQPEDVKTLASFLNRLASDLAQTKAMGEVARKHALQLTWGNMTEQYISVYSELLRDDHSDVRKLP